MDCDGEHCCYSKIDTMLKRALVHIIFLPGSQKFCSECNFDSQHNFTAISEKFMKIKARWDH